VEKVDRVRGSGQKLRLSPEREHDGCHLRRLKKENQADALVPRRLPDHRDREKGFRLHRLNAAEADREKANDPRGPVEQTDRPEQGEPRRRQLWRARRRSSSKNMVARQCDDQASSKVHVKVSLRKARQRVRINGYGSGRRRRARPWGRLNKADRGAVPPD
jgi:hypothetical protein